MSNEIELKEHKLFERVVSILEDARSNTVRAINSQIVIAYWLIGKEIVLQFQSGDNRAEYGNRILGNLSNMLTKKYGKGFSVSNLQNFRKFYQAYSERIIIQDPIGTELPQSAVSTISYPVGTNSENTVTSSFSPRLTWSHYRALMRVKNTEARTFYENEAIVTGWDKRTLERQIQSSFFERILRSDKSQKMIESGRKELSNSQQPIESLKNPYVLEFLDLPDSAVLHERDIETAIITQLQSFLLELGKGFAFVARQKQMRYDDTNLYIDLVFYNCILKCYVLIDLKMGELTHKDVGQMDSYVRMFDELHTTDDDNPTIGLILCAEKNEAVARYSVLNDRKQIFASKYMLYLPSEEELQQELIKERRLIEAQLEDSHN